MSIITASENLQTRRSYWQARHVIMNIPQAVHVAMIYYYYYYYLKLGCFKNRIVFFVRVKVFITFFLGGDNPVRQTD